ncbi:protein-glutamate methylesterase/protein-glutamine glutaminase [Aestuariibacter salexigens]|uniref:protein-glutamate methylesterase/protein-glutamine glutaminase n=1 Tax=Aestuariibacter salexigens TaxID=226010 RepID=UPI0003F76922|nr:chemotaxis response regulator protein-glutamate methylesterase [Aestuariibacter salexigens]
MTYKVLVVDDSSFFRRRVSQILQQDPQIEVVGDARDGKEAIAKAESLDPDVVTMDVEMPVLDGISAVRAIMAKRPVPILMFSSLTHEGARATLDALDAGAMDFLPKKFEDIAQDRQEAVEALRTKVKTLARRKSGMRFRSMGTGLSRSTTDTGTTAKTRLFFRGSSGLAPKAENESISRQITRRSGKQYKLLAIGTSTGGPVALQKILVELPAHFPMPIVLVQHMPGTFTSAFAQRLNGLCKINVKEAEHGERLTSGTAYLAPGGKQMFIEGNAGHATVRISDPSGADNTTYKPSVDLTFTSLAQVFGGDVLGVILTGMGADGREGCRAMKAKGARIWAQDEQSSVVYGMPQAVAAANLTDAILALDDIAGSLKTELL